MVLTSAGATDQRVAVTGTINALPTVNKPGDVTYINGDLTTVINFAGTGTTFTWTNDKPGIGLPANGTGDIPSFTAVNTGPTAITATIKVTPANATGCPGIPQTFTIKVNASPAITATVVSGSISACVGTASASPNIQQFTVSGTGLTAGITVTAPAGFEVSLSANNGFSGAVTLNQSAGKVTNVLVYVRSAASAVVGPISGKITLATAGATNLTVEVSGTVSALPVVDPVGDKIYVNGDITTAVNFTGTGNIFHWVNDTPAIGLPASGTGDLPSFTAVNVSGSQLKATITVTPETKKYGYVTNANDNTVSVIDISTNKAVATIPVGSNPVRITISPDGSRVYVTNESSDDVSVINTSTNSVINTIPVGGVPSATVISSDGSKLYVANIYDNNISVISTGSSSVVKTIPAGLTPLGVVLSNDGKLLYVSNNGENDLWVIDTATGALIDNIPVGKQAEGIAMSRDGNWVYVSNFQDGTISVINTATNKVTATLPIGSNPSAITVTPDGKLLYSTSDLDDKILVIDIASKQIVKTITVGTKPWGMLLNRDGSLLYVTTPADNTVLVINTATNQVVNKILVGAAPSAFGTLAVPGADCPGIPATFTITVNVQTPSITHSAVTGTIIACAGSPSASPNVQQFAVSGTALTGDITAMAPIGFEVSLSAISGFTKSVTLARTNGSVSNVVVYVRSADYAIGSVSGDVDLSTPGIPTQTVPVRGLVNALPTVNAIGNQTKQDGDVTDAISFAGSGNQFRWTNDKPGIGLPAAGLGDIAAFKAINTGAADITATITVTPLKLGYAYIPDLQSNDVSVVSLASNSVIAFLPVGNHPIGVTINARNNLIYVTNADGSTVSIIDPATNTVKGAIPVGSSPYGIKSNADGSLLFVASLNGNSVAVIDVLTNAVIHTIVGFTGPIDVAVSPDGGTLYVSNNRSTTVSVIRIADYTLQKTINVGEAPFGLCFSPDGSKLYVANETSRDISVINTATNTVSGTITGNFSPLYLGISPDGSRLYIPNVASTNVSVVNTATNAVVATIEGFGQPTGVNVSPDGKFVYVTSQSENKLSVIDAATNTVFNEIPVGKDPAAIGTFLSPSPACDGQPVTFTITVKASLPPAITNDQPPNGVNTIYGTPSPVTSFTISGRDMREGIKVTPPAGVEVSTDNINFSNTITVGAAGTIAPTTIYVRLAKTTPVGSYGGSISLESTGVNTIYPQLPVSLVSPAPLTVIANAKSKNYGILLAGAPGSADFTVAGLQNSETVQTVTITYGQGSAATDPAGTYAGSVTPADVTGGTFDPKNYAISYMNADLTVNKTPLTITADDKIKTYKDPNPALTLTYSGFVNNESPAQLTSLPVVSTIADETSLPGKYTILVSGAASPNYDIALVNGVLTVLGINVPLKIPNTFTPNDDGINDTWNIANIDSYPGCIVNIYNRWGQNVFSSVGYGKSWDGRYKGTLLPVSTYYYIIDLKNDSKPYSGSITIIR
ncbi:beta-propeller fold lactonase family protein [Mucilaginibacter sp. RT5R15]|nr:beta-propeller fold lactonase family protein [Mucilaginibacter flavidus]